MLLACGLESVARSEDLVLNLSTVQHQASETTAEAGDGPSKRASLRPGAMCLSVMEVEAEIRTH